MNNPLGLSYIVRGQLSDGTSLRLTDTYVDVAENPNYSAQFPQLTSVTIEVKNSFGEVSKAT